VDAGMTYDTTTDTLYAISGGQPHDFESSLLYSLDVDTGETTLIGEDTLHYASSLAINANGEAYALDATFSDRLYSVDLASGLLSPTAALTTSPPGMTLRSGGLAFAPDGTLWATSNSMPRRVFRVDPETGVATYVSDISAHQPGFRWDFLAIPIPAPSTLSLCALGAVAVLRRR